MKTRKPATGPHPDCIRAWEAAWLRTRGCGFAWTAKDAALIAKALRLAGGAASLVVARIERLLSETDDEWIVRNASPGLLVARWNQLAFEPPKKPKVTPLPVYRPDPSPRIPPPPGLYQQFLAEKQRYAQRLPKPGATNAPSP